MHRVLRLLLLLVCLAPAAAGEDVVHLRNGRTLHGTVVSESEEEVVIDVGAGRVTFPRSAVRLVERGATRRPPRKVVTQRDEWFLVTHHDKLVGWRRLVQTQTDRLIRVEERTVFFRPGGGDDVDTRRVEVADLDGGPREFLLMETYGTDAEVVGGRVRDGRVLVTIRRGDSITTRELDLPAGWVLALPAWSRFLEEAKPGESRTITALDLRRLRPLKLLLSREEDAAAPGVRGPLPCRAISLITDERRSRALYRPGEGSLSIELNGRSLVARRSTKERVELARRAHLAPKRLTVEQALRFPFHEREKELTTIHARAGVGLTAPDAGWIPRVKAETDRGLVLSFEKISLFSSLEVFVYPSSAAEGADECLARALARVRLTARRAEATGQPEEREIGGFPGRIVVFDAIHRGEELRCLLAVARAQDRYVLLIGAAPERYWRWARKDFESFLASCEIAR